ncbi:MAG: pilus assembly FimT family protein [Gemmatimonadaceae bacterium]
MLPKHSSQTRQQRRSVSHPGFSMLEMLVVIIILGILVTIAIPKIATMIRHERVNRAAQVVAQDLQNGFAMAGRQRAPVRITFYPETQRYVFTDRTSGNVLQTRLLSEGSDFSIKQMTVEPGNEVDVLPNGIGSVSFVVTLANGDYSRKVTASSAGFVRMTPQ